MDEKQINYKLAQKRLKTVQDELFKFQKSKNKSLVGGVVEVLVENKLKDQDKFFGRNSKISVRYEDGRIIKDIKFKKVESDINAEKCTIIED